MFRRILASAGIAAAVVGVGIAGAGASAAAPAPLPQFGLLPMDLTVTGDHAFCHGVVHTSLSYDRAKPGVSTLTVSSPGFTGTGPSWAADPVCRFGLLTSWNATAAKKNIPMAIGASPMKPVSIDLPTGYGVNLVGVEPVHNTPLSPVMAGTYFSNYTFLPPW